MKLIVLSAVMIIGVLYIDIIFNAVMWLLPRRQRCNVCQARSLSYTRHTTSSPGHCSKCGAESVVSRHRRHFKLIDLIKS